MKTKCQKFISLLLLVSTLLLTASFQQGANASIDENPEAVEALSKCLKEKSATMYGTANCGHCNRQKEMFGPYFKNIRFVDCRSGSANAKECNQAKVGKFPQWNFENGQRIVREANLDQIAQASDCREYVARAVGQEVLTSSASNNKQPLSNAKEIANTSVKTTDASYTNSSYGSTQQLAKCLKDKGVVFYGSPKCYHCNKQKEMFQGAFEQYLSSNFHNCKGSDQEQLECSRKGTFPFPTWIEPSTGKKLVGPERSLESIAKAFSCTASSQVTPKQASNQAVETTGAQESPAENYTNNNSDYAPSPSFTPSAGQSQLDSYTTPSTENSQTSLEQTTSESQLASAAPSYFDTQKDLLQQRQNKLATCLVNRNIILYGITNSQKNQSIQYKATQEQLVELGEASNKIKVVDCSNGQAECSGILVYPTWILDDKKELAGVYELGNLAQILGCQIDE